ncbi:unnamed protein product [Symbiodinium pilosum]|uniref:Uncharacterized protein n=1 Tax=Symbiodinium pilosum TaxID=2952 RepID=A0A812VLU6_SYMPI|nr:unnamed protein product [Symbiodinium pilosum]
MWLAAQHRWPHSSQDGSETFEPSDSCPDSPLRPIGLNYDFIEVFGGSGRVSDAMRDLGFVCGPVLEAQSTPPLETRRLRSLMIGPFTLYTWRASCAYGCKRKKEFAFLSCHVPSTERAVLAQEAMFTIALHSSPPEEDSFTPGFENLLVNDFLCGASWQVLLDWRWKKQSHINRLESERCNALCKRLLLRGGDLRFPIIPDSAVTLGAHRKGRSSARFLRSSLRVRGRLRPLAFLERGIPFPPLHFCSSSCIQHVPCCFPVIGLIIPVLLIVPLLSLPVVLSRLTPFLVEPFVELLVQYGHDLYGSGRPYYHFSETINAVTARKPILRRQVQAAWDVAFTWLAEEPSTHHVAMPPSVLLALLSACLAWGWVREAGIFALCWGALLRVSEATKATRGHLVFPADALWMQPFVLVKIDEPKTRGRAAKHQAAKLEPSDLVSIVSLAFESFPKASLGNAEETFRHSS